MNKICINGRLTKDPELKPLENDNSLCSFFIANDVHFGNNKKTGFYRCTAFGNIAKIIADHAKKGTELFISGRLDQRRYEDKDGKSVNDVSIIIDQFDFGAKPASSNGSDMADKELAEIAF